MTPKNLLTKTKLEIIKFFKSIFKGANLRPRISGWCAIFRDTDHPCHKPASALMNMIDARGFFCRLPVCADHNPKTNSWTERHFDLKGWKIQSVISSEHRE